VSNVHPAFTGILANFSTQHDRLTRLEIERENRAEDVSDLNVIRRDLAIAFKFAEASDVSGMDTIAQSIDDVIGALDAIIERVDLIGD
jgi:hypothetical protein